MATAPVTSPTASPAPGGDPRRIPDLSRRVHGLKLAYLDNGATAQKPLAVIDTLDRYWREHNANVHRGVHTLSEEATAALRGGSRHDRAPPGRRAARGHLHPQRDRVLNLVAHAWGRANVGEGDRILLTEMEHHSNIVPWYLLAREVGAKLDWVPVDGDGRLDMEALAAAMERGPKLVAVAHVSNVLGTINPWSRSHGWPTRPGRSWSSTEPRPPRSCSSTCQPLERTSTGSRATSSTGPPGWAFSTVAASSSRPWSRSKGADR